MLNDTTKRKINSLRQILVGKVPDPKSQVDQITNALIYKYMDDMDRQAEAFGGKASFFTGEYEKYSWRHLMDPRLGGQERLNLYVEALERMSGNTSLSPIFRDILKGAFLPYRSPETLNLFLTEINGFSYEHSEELGNAYEYLLSIMGSQGDAGQFRTPRHIIDFIVAVIDPKKTDKILDPACGTAGFLISAYKHIIANHDGKDNVTGEPTDKETRLSPQEMKALHKNFIGYDTAPEMVKLSRANMFLHQFPDPKISEYDTLDRDDEWDQKFDLVLANPPFQTKGKVFPHSKFLLKTNVPALLFTEYALEHLKPKGRIGIIVPEGVIFGSSGAQIKLRKKLVDEGLVAVVSLPGGIFKPYSGVKTSILFIDRECARLTHEIAFVKVSYDGFDLGDKRTPTPDKNNLPEAERILAAWRKGEKLESPLATWVSRENIAEGGDYNLSGDRYRVATDYANAKWSMVELGAVCEINPKKSEITELQPDSEVSFVPMADISENDASFIPRQSKVFSEVSTSYTYFRNGDVLLAKVTPCFENGKAGIARHLKNGIGFGSSEFIVVRPTENILPELVYAFITSEDFRIVGKQQMTGTGGLQRVPTDFVRKYKIPLPPLEIQKQIVAELDGYQNIITGAKQVIANWKPKIEIDPEWEMVKLGDVCEMASGGTPSKSNPGFWTGNIPWVSSKDMKVDFLEDTEDHVSELAVKESSTKIVKRGTLLGVVRSGILQHTFPVAITTRPMCHNQDITSFTSDDSRLDVRYLFYTFKAENKKILEEGIKPGVTVQSFFSGFFKEYQIPLPPLEIQKQIVENIEAERALVEGNKQLIGIYETKMKEAIGKLWSE
jgi:type I restriction enzyme M protein